MPGPIPPSALQALLAPDAALPVLIAEASAAHVSVAGERLGEAVLARRVRDEGAVVVVVHSIGPTLARALRERPPALLVLTGPADPDSLPAEAPLLGPDARLYVRDRGDSVACATSPAELADLLAALSPGTGELSSGTGDRDRRLSSGTDEGDRSRLSSGSDALSTARRLSSGTDEADRRNLSSGTDAATTARRMSPGTDEGDRNNLSSGPATSPPGVRLAACPTPPWWPLWLGDPRLAGTVALGFVGAASLHPGWARWAREAGAVDHVLVPLGLETARLEHPRHPSLAAAVAAHALERFTGPVFPAAQVLALLRPRAPVPEDRPDPAALARWSQAVRALPLVGAGPGMEAPLPGLSQVSPAPAFIAQRTLLRRAHARALPRGPALPALDPAAVARAEEVLRGAGQVLSEHESKVVLRGFGVEITRQAVASSASGAAQYADTIGYPVVLKAVSPDLRRKQELGAVVLGLTTSAAVRRAYATIVQNVEQHAPTAHLDGVLVAEQAPEGLELHCGAVRLHTGEVAIFGRPLGLPLPVEPTLALSPLDPREAVLLAHAVLARVPPLRRASDPGVAELAELLLRLDAMVRHFDRADVSAGAAGRLISVELSPLRLVGPPRGYLTLDARIVQRAHLEGA